jgi:hypothetical protein
MLLRDKMGLRPDLAVYNALIESMCTCCRFSLVHTTTRSIYQHTYLVNYKDQCTSYNIAFVAGSLSKMLVNFRLLLHDWNWRPPARTTTRVFTRLLEFNRADLIVQLAEQVHTHSILVCRI